MLNIETLLLIALGMEDAWKYKEHFRYLIEPRDIDKEGVWPYRNRIAAAIRRECVALIALRLNDVGVT